MRLARRGPLHARPIPFLGGLALAVLGFGQGLNWAWDWTLQTGNVFILIQIPTQLLAFEGTKGVFLTLGFIGLAVMVLLGMAGRRAADRAARKGAGVWGPRFRVYPVVVGLAIFLAFFGVMFLFMASVAADDSSEGFIAFVYLNYAGIARRGVISILGLALLGAGGFLLSRCVSPGLGIPSLRRPSAPAPPAREPSPGWLADASAPALTTPRPAPRVAAAPMRRAAPTPNARPTPRPTLSASPTSSAFPRARSPVRPAPPARTAARSTPP